MVEGALQVAGKTEVDRIIKYRMDFCSHFASRFAVTFAVTLLHDLQSLCSQPNPHDYRGSKVCSTEGTYSSELVWFVSVRCA